MTTTTTPTPHPQRRLRLALGWGLVAALAVLATWMGGIAIDLMLLIMSVVELLGGDLVLPFAPDWSGMVLRVAATGAAVLVAWRVLRYQRVSRSACGRCGRSDLPSADLRRLAKRLAWLSVVPAGGYAALKLHWAFGGTFGLADPSLFADIDLTSPGFVDTAVMAAIGIGVALAMAYRRPRVPRWLLLTPALIGCGMLLSVSIIGTGTNLVGLLTEAPFTGLSPWVPWLVYAAFLTWGVCLTIVTGEYHYATRRRCGTCGRGGCARIGE